jgi:hypothetical protein
MNVDSNINDYCSQEAFLKPTSNKGYAKKE